MDAQASLSLLPPELLDTIASHLPPYAAHSLSQACTRFRVYQPDTLDARGRWILDSVRSFEAACTEEAASHGVRLACAHCFHAHAREDFSAPMQETSARSRFCLPRESHFVVSSTRSWSFDDVRTQVVIYPVSRYYTQRMGPESERSQHDVNVGAHDEWNNTLGCAQEEHKSIIKRYQIEARVIDPELEADFDNLEMAHSFAIPICPHQSSIGGPSLSEWKSKSRQGCSECGTVVTVHVGQQRACSSCGTFDCGNAHQVPPLPDGQRVIIINVEACVDNLSSPWGQWWKLVRSGVKHPERWEPDDQDEENLPIVREALAVRDLEKSEDIGFDARLNFEAYFRNGHQTAKAEIHDL